MELSPWHYLFLWHYFVLNFKFSRVNISSFNWNRNRRKLRLAGRFVECFAYYVNKTHMKNDWRNRFTQGWMKHFICVVHFAMEVRINYIEYLLCLSENLWPCCGENIEINNCIMSREMFSNSTVIFYISLRSINLNLKRVFPIMIDHWKSQGHFIEKLSWD